MTAKRKTRRQLNVVAWLTIKGAATMTPARRKDIAAWLRRHADDIIRDGSRYSARFRGHYHSPD